MSAPFWQLLKPPKIWHLAALGILCFCWQAGRVNAQCSVFLGNDTTFCTGNNLLLDAGPGFTTYNWSNNTTNQTLNVTASGTYTVTASVFSNNVITNGDFSQGNVAFTTQYTYNPTTLWNAGTYTVGPNPNSVHPNFPAYPDHTTGTGNYLIVNGSPIAGQQVWCQTVTVNANTWYNFSAWVLTLVASNPAILQFSINGSTIGTPYSAPSNPGVWAPFNATWFSGTNTSATICVVNQNTAGGGNDFGLDDISFSEATCTAIDTIVVTILPNSDATITAPSLLCDNANPVNLTAADPGGTWTVNGNSNAGVFDPAQAIVGNNQVTYTIPGICGDTDQVNIQVDTAPNPTITPVGPFCSVSSSLPLTTATPGGVWNGTGVSSLGVFDPANANVGNNQIIYSFAGNCPASDTLDIVVNQSQDATITPALPLCISNLAINLNAADPGGTWTGTGITDPIAGTFDPATAGTGNHTITYSIGGMCGDTHSIPMQVWGLPDPTVFPPGIICDNAGIQTLQSLIPGGTWSGNGIINPQTGFFDPTTSGLGSHTIQYLISDTNNCADSTSFNVTVNASVNSNILPPGDFCISDPAVMLSSIDPGGIWSGSGIQNNTTGLFDAAAAGVGTHQITYGIAGTCGDTSSLSVTVHDLPNTQILNVGPYCANLPAFNLQAATPGGNWQGSGISSQNLGTFDPNVAGPGLHTIIYSLLDSNGCFNSSSLDLTINPYADPTILTEPSFCIGDASFDMQALDPGGIWAGMGITNNLSGTFLPGDAGAGIHMITYSTGGNCPDADTVWIEVSENPILELPPDTSICGVSFLIEPGNTYSSYVWHDGYTGSDYLVRKPGYYILQVENDFGCVAVDTMFIGLDCPDAHIWIPKAFTPDGDGLNDAFQVYGEYIEDFSIRIFDRWGQMVYRNVDFSFQWDGTHQGKMCPIGTYTYRVEYKGYTNNLFETKELYGQVTLVR